MKNNTPPASGSVAPLSLKLTLIGGGILIMVMLVFTVRSIIGILCPSSSPPAAVQTNTETVVVQLKTPVGTPLSSVSDNFGAQISPNLSPVATPSSQPMTFAEQNEIMKQREKARVETIEALKREAQEQAGTSGVPKEALQKLEQSDPILY